VKTQAFTTLTRGALGLAALLFVLLPLAFASTRVHHYHNDVWARQQFARADRMREALNGRPLAERTRRDYQRVIDAYRRVYFGSPGSSKADPSVVATAELMVEMGRRFEDNKILRGAIEQYHFLRKEYPGSKYRFDALFTIGEIFKDDLNDLEDARKTFQDFLQRYPRNRLADDARAAVKAIDTEAEERERTAQKALRKRRTPNTNAGPGASVSVNTDAAMESAGVASGTRSTLPRVTGVRHWSTPDYTRVAIDVEQEVKFASQRISNPDRIFFDLRDTKLASTLVGKTFDVDDGFLKKIRVAEFQPRRTPIVLEVDDLASYDAFLLPDPYRLIIDIHGKEDGSQQNGFAGSATEAMTNTKVSSDTATTAFPETDGGSGEPEPFSIGDSKSAARKTQAKSSGKKDVIRFKKSGPVETDLPAEDTNVDSKSADATKPVNGIGVIKTTVSVKGSDRKIPKTIVEADDRVPSTVAALEHEKLRPEVKPGEENRPPVADQDNATRGGSRPPSAPASTRPKKLGSSAGRSLSGASGVRSNNLESREARPTAAGDRSLTRALGLKIGKIVIDAGHGGHDAGTIGPNGLAEKDVVLDVAKRLGRLLETRLGAEVVYTRKDDTFIPLETRTAIANRERADLFISIHANSSRDSDARGVETYYLNFTSSPEALEVAARENAVSEKSIHELQDLVKKIALKEKIEESREFAGDVQHSLYGGLALSSAGVRDRGVKKAPFIVLIGANMPSILAEISFVSNPTDERKLETAEHRQRIAESLFRGVSKYVNGLSGVKVASKMDKPEGQ
jgi:N-acetylmuramoyl-L-alanine amidase